MIALHQLAVLVPAALVFYWVGAAIYSVLFHPLSKYPGPFWAKITGWYEFNNAASGQHHAWLYELHEQYGPVVRVAPNRLSYNTIEALKSIYAERKANIKKAGFTETIAMLSGGRNLQTINDKHAYPARRRLIAHAFSEEALRSSEVYILQSIREWCGIFKSKVEGPESWSANINMKDWANLLTEDILSELCFGESFESCKKGESEFAQITEDSVKTAQQLCWMPLGDTFFHLLAGLVGYGKKQRWKALIPSIRFEETIESMITRRLQLTNTTRKDIIHYILQAKDLENTGETITHAGIRNEAGVIYGAGADTSATTIAACLFYLVHYPGVLAKLTAEIRNAFSDVEEITSLRSQSGSSKLSALTYLRACIDETLRCSPPAPGTLLREVTGSGAMIGGDFLPSGTQVGIAPYVIHHNDTYYDDPWNFRPERWLEKTDKPLREAFFAFSSGWRVCIGRQLAYLDMTLALATLLFEFDVRLAPGVAYTKQERQHKNKTEKVIEYKMDDWFIVAREGPMVQFRPVRG